MITLKKILKQEKIVHRCMKEQRNYLTWLNDIILSIKLKMKAIDKYLKPKNSLPMIQKASMDHI